MCLTRPDFPLCCCALCAGEQLSLISLSSYCVNPCDMCKNPICKPAQCIHITYRLFRNEISEILFKFSLILSAGTIFLLRASPHPAWLARKRFGRFPASFGRFPARIFRGIFLEIFGAFVVLIFYAFLLWSLTFSLNVKCVQHRARYRWVSSLSPLRLEAPPQI